MPAPVQQRSNNRMEADRKRSGCRTMVAIDESSCSCHALEWVLNNLGDSSSEPLVLYNVQPASALSRVPAAAYGPARMFTAMSASPELIRSLREQQSKFAVALLERAREICATHGVKAEVVTEVGEPEEAICKAVDRLNIGLLVLGSHGRGALERAFLGSVSRHCLKKARCPVIVVTKTDKGEFGLVSRNI